MLPGWPIRMMQWNIALIYVISLPYKLAQDPGWVTGDAIHWTVASDMWGPSQYPWITLAFGGFIRKAMTFGTVLIEAFSSGCVVQTNTVTAVIAICKSSSRSCSAYSKRHLFHALHGLLLYRLPCRRGISIFLNPGCLRLVKHSTRVVRACKDRMKPATQLGKIFLRMLSW